MIVTKILETDEKSEKRLIQSITRASEILSLFLNEKRPLGITDFARSLSLSKNTVQGIVNTLLYLNYLEKDTTTKKYRLGPGLFQLGLAYASNMDMLTTSKVWLERLCYKLNMMVKIGIFVGNRVLILYSVEPEFGFINIPQQVGLVIPAHSSSIGKILLAFMDEKNRDNILQDYNFESYTKNSLKNREELINELVQIKRDSIGFDNEESLMGVACIGAPIFNKAGNIIAAFSVSGEASLVYEKREAIIQEVRYTSREISSVLGYSKFI